MYPFFKDKKATLKINKTLKRIYKKKKKINNIVIFDVYVYYIMYIIYTNSVDSFFYVVRNVWFLQKTIKISNIKFNPKSLSTQSFPQHLARSADTVVLFEIFVTFFFVFVNSLFRTKHIILYERGITAQIDKIYIFFLFLQIFFKYKICNRGLILYPLQTIT